MKKGPSTLIASISIKLKVLAEMLLYPFNTDAGQYQNTVTVATYHGSDVDQLLVSSVAKYNPWCLTDYSNYKSQSITLYKPLRWTFKQRVSNSQRKFNKRRL